MSSKIKKIKTIPVQYGDASCVIILKTDGKNEKVYASIYDAEKKTLIYAIDSTPFPYGCDLSGIKYVQSFDVVFFVEPSTYPCKLVRKNAELNEGYVWTFEQCDIMPEPLLDWNYTSKHIFKISAIPDEDARHTKEDGSTYYPKGTLRKASATSIVEQLPHFIVKKAYTKATKHDASTAAVDLFLEITNSNFELIAGTTIDISVLKLAVGYTAENVSWAEYGYGYKYGWKDEEYKYTAIDNRYYDLTGTLFVGVVRVINDTTLMVCHNRLFGAYSYETMSFSANINARDDLQYPRYLGVRGGFWLAKEDAPSSEACTNLYYYEQFKGGRNALVALTVDGTNTNENLKAGMIIALQTKNQLTFSENLNYDDMPVGTDYATCAVFPPVELDTKLASLKAATGEQLRPDSGGGYGWSSDWMPIRGKISLKTNGKWSGTIRLQELSEDGNLTELAKITSENAGSNTELSRDVKNFGSAIRLVCTRREKAYYLLSTIAGSDNGTLTEKIMRQDSGCQIEMKSTENRTAYIRLVKKRTLLNGTQCWVAECLGGVFGEFETDNYALGAWSKENGYPRHISIYQERMIYAGNAAKPMTIWASKVNDWGDFELGTADTSAMSFTAYSEKYDAISWLKVTRAGIFVGTQHCEYIFGEANGGTTTAKNARFVNTSNVGSENIPGVLFGDSMLVVKKGATEVHTVAYNTLTEESAGTQISMTAKHLFEDDPVVDMFVTKSPTNSVYFLCESGKLASLTYEPSFNVEGWARHTILDGVVAGTVLRRNGVDILTLVVEKDGELLLGELDPNSEVWTDDGENYESVLEPTPLISDNYEGGVYGHRTNFVGADVYVDKGKRFTAQLYGGDEIRVDLGFNWKNELNEFEREKKIELNANSSWKDEAGLIIKTSEPAPLVITAIGARVKHS